MLFAVMLEREGFEAICIFLGIFSVPLCDICRKIVAYVNARNLGAPPHIFEPSTFACSFKWTADGFAAVFSQSSPSIFGFVPISIDYCMLCSNRYRSAFF